MSVKLFKPNPRNTGVLGSFEFFSINNERPEFFVTLLPQKTWDAANKTASFNQEGKLIFKLNEFELGSIVYSFNKKTKFSAFHKFGEETTTISITPTEREPRDSVPRPGFFMLYVAKPNGTKYNLPIENGEFVRINSYVNRFFEAIDAWDEFEKKKYFKNSVPKNKNVEKEPDYFLIDRGPDVQAPVNSDSTADSDADSGDLF